MPRLNIERQKKLEPERMNYAQKQIEKKGYEVTRLSSALLSFKFKGKIVYFYPYSGWASGKTIKDCRGIHKLLKQI